MKIENKNARNLKNIALTLAYEIDLYVARHLIHEGCLDQAFKKLETAHVLGQRHVLRHVETHWAMLTIGYQRRSTREVSGQLIRIILGVLGSCIGIVPSGNTGGTNVGLFQRLPIAPDLQRLLK